LAPAIGVSAAFAFAAALAGLVLPARHGRAPHRAAEAPTGDTGDTSWSVPAPAELPA